jgi:hypothetical protein
LQQLTGRHLAMGRMVSGGNMLFVDDEKWRKEHLTEKPKLPLFVKVEDKQAVEVAGKKCYKISDNPGIRFSH